MYTRFSAESDMSCWVVPEIAADLWGIPLEQVFDRIRDGSIQSKCEGGFIFVDVQTPIGRFMPGN